VSVGAEGAVGEVRLQVEHGAPPEDLLIPGVNPDGVHLGDVKGGEEVGDGLLRELKVSMLECQKRKKEKNSGTDHPQKVRGKRQGVKRPPPVSSPIRE